VKSLRNLNYVLAVKRLFKDMRDDWFVDPLMYKDFLDNKRVKKYFASDTGERFGHIAEQFNLPKAGFTLRYSLQTFVFDRLLYQALIDQLIELYDPLLLPICYSNRLRLGRGPFIFQDGVSSWRNFIQDVSVELESGKKVLLVTDIQNYFECIEIYRLEMILRSSSCAKDRNNSESIDLLIGLLRKWSPDGQRGIPQNQDASHFLANIYMNRFDHQMLSAKHKYFRYVDDIRIVCRDEFAARKVLKDLIIELRRIGLNVNSKKTKILKPDYSNREFAECMPQPNRVIEEIDALWKHRTVSSARVALPKLHAYTQQLISEGKTNEREFRFCINRLEQIARCSVLSFDFSGIIAPAVDLLVAQPSSSDSVIRLLRVAPLKGAHVEKIRRFALDKRRNIYEWQGYLIWQLLTMLEKKQKRGTKSFRELAKSIITQDWAPPMKGGAILYLGACGDGSDKRHLLKKFSQNSSSRMIVRSTVIASQEMSEVELERYLYPYISFQDRESLKIIRSSDFNGRYLEPLSDLHPKELFDNLPTITSG